MGSDNGPTEEFMAYAWAFLITWRGRIEAPPIARADLMLRYIKSRRFISFSFFDHISVAWHLTMTHLSIDANFTPDPSK
jgi:hypothetical protein